jgi:hypothetical protein
MEGPHPPGYSPSVTGVRAPDKPRGLPRLGKPIRGPVALYGQVYRYGPRQARKTYVLRALLGMRLPDIECVWRGPERAVPNDTMSDEWQATMNKCAAEATVLADLLNTIDPGATGGPRVTAFCNSR